MANKKRRMLACMGILTVVLTVSASGCKGTENSREKTQTEEKTRAESADAQTGTDTEQDIEIREIEEKSWEEKAKITCGERVRIDGSGAEAHEAVISISEGGAYEVTGTLTDGMIYIETEEAVKLILNGASITSTTGPAIYAYDSEEVWIELADGTENTLTDASEYEAVYKEETEGETDTEEEETGKGAVFSNDDLIFTGTGSLTVTGNYKHAVCSDDSVYFEEGTYNLSAVKDGVHVKDALVVNGGSIQVTQANDGMESGGALVFNGGVYLASVEDDGMTAAGDLTVNDGEIIVTACEEGLEAKGSLYVNGGTVEITANNDGINGGTFVQINDGLIYTVTSVGDGIDSNGELKIGGGIVIALGGNEPEGGVDCDQNAFTITGGVLIATGGVNSAPSEEACTQAVVLLGAASEGDSIGIKDASGNTVLAFQVSKSCSNLLLSGGFLEMEDSYTVYTGGTVTGAETFYGYYADSEYEGGSESVTFTVDGMVISAGGTAGMQGGRGGGMQEGMPENRAEGEDGKLPQDGGTPQMPGRRELPQMPENGETPQMPENGGTPQMPENSETPQMPENGGTPQMPENGGTPQMPEQSETDNSL